MKKKKKKSHVFLLLNGKQLILESLCNSMLRRNRLNGQPNVSGVT